MMDTILFGLGFTVFVYAAWMICSPFLDGLSTKETSQSDQAIGPSNSWTGARERSIEALADLEEEFQSGKIARAEYEFQKTKLIDAALEQPRGS